MAPPPENGQRHHRAAVDDRAWQPVDGGAIYVAVCYFLADQRPRHHLVPQRLACDRRLDLVSRRRWDQFGGLVCVAREYLGICSIDWADLGLGATMPGSLLDAVSRVVRQV